MAPKAKPVVNEPQTGTEGVVLKVLSLGGELPKKHSTGAAGLDLCVAADCRLMPVTVAEKAYVVPTGIAVEIPEGYHGKVFLRSSTGKNRKIRLANGTGIIDSDYRGEVLLLLENVGVFPERLDAGDRIAQLIIEKNVDFTVQEVTELSPTIRGSGGVGSTN